LTDAEAIESFCEDVTAEECVCDCDTNRVVVANIFRLLKSILNLPVSRQETEASDQHQVGGIISLLMVLKATRKLVLTSSIRDRKIESYLVLLLKIVLDLFAAKSPISKPRESESQESKCVELAIEILAHILCGELLDGDDYEPVMLMTKELEREGRKHHHLLNAVKSSLDRTLQCDQARLIGKHIQQFINVLLLGDRFAPLARKDIDRDIFVSTSRSNGAANSEDAVGCSCHHMEIDQEPFIYEANLYTESITTVVGDAS
jgi:hypothetical protein